MAYIYCQNLIFFLHFLSIYLAYFRRSLSPHRLFFHALQYFMKMVLGVSIIVVYSYENRYKGEWHSPLLYVYRNENCCKI